MIALDADERREYERLREYYGGSYAAGDSPTLAAIARSRVARRRELERTALRQFRSALDLSWLDELTLYGAWRVARRKVVPVVTRMVGNWQTSLLGFLVALLLYLQQNGAKFPETWAEWKAAFLAAAVQAFGLTAKDARTGSRPGATD